MFRIHEVERDNELLFWIYQMRVRIGVVVMIWLIPGIIYYAFKYPATRPFHLIPYFKDHHVAIIMLVLALLASWFFFSGSFGHRRIFLDLMRKSQVQEAAMNLMAISKGRTVVYPSFKAFCKSRNIRSFEDRYIRFYNKLRSDAIKYKHFGERARATQAVIDTEKELEGQFAGALLSVTSEAEHDLYVKRFNASLGASGSRSLSRRIIAELLAKGQKRDEEEDKGAAKARRLRDTLTRLSPGGLCLSSKALLEEADASPYTSQAIRLIKQAVSAQQKFNKLSVEEPAEVKVQTDTRPPGEYRFETLKDLIARDYNLSDLVPEDRNTDLVTQILVALMEPGKRDVHTFKENYKPYDTLKRKVVRLYRTRVKKPFPSRIFDETLAWMLQEGILISKRKTDERVYSFNNIPGDCASAFAAEIVRRTNTFERSIKSD